MQLSVPSDDRKKKKYKKTATKQQLGRRRVAAMLRHLANQGGKRLYSSRKRVTIVFNHRCVFYSTLRMRSGARLGQYCADRPAIEHETFFIILNSLFFRRKVQPCIPLKVHTGKLFLPNAALVLPECGERRLEFSGAVHHHVSKLVRWKKSR